MSLDSCLMNVNLRQFAKARRHLYCQNVVKYYPVVVELTAHDLSRCQRKTANLTYDWK